MRRASALYCVTAALLVLAACSQGPPRVNQPYIDADGAGELAMEQYDTNGDGVVGGEELDKAPGLKAMLATADTNGDKAISAEEVTARIEQWQTMRTGLMSFSFVAKLDGKPLEDATVTIVPETFLGEEIKAAVATTDMFGSGGPSIPKEQRPDPKTTPPGVQIGLYKVKISKIANGREMIPPSYNETTTLGLEIAPDVSDILNRRVVFEVKTK
jgi:hypothetical protein